MYLSIMMGYDDHQSVYIINKEIAEILQSIGDVDDLNSTIVEQGMYIDAGMNYEADLFLDATGDDATEFLDELATALVSDEHGHTIYG